MTSSSGAVAYVGKELKDELWAIWHHHQYKTKAMLHEWYCIAMTTTQGKLASGGWSLIFHFLASHKISNKVSEYIFSRFLIEVGMQPGTCLWKIRNAPNNRDQLTFVHSLLQHAAYRTVIESYLCQVLEYKNSIYKIYVFFSLSNLL